MSLAAPKPSRIDGTPFRLAVVAARFNPALVDGLLARVTDGLRAAGVKAGRIDIHRVPGSHEVPWAAARVASVTFGWAPNAGSGAADSTIWLATLPTPSISTSTVAPGATGREPAGVPVRITSPGSSVTKRERSATSRPKGKTSSAVSSSWTTSPSTRVRSVSAARSSPSIATGSPIGVKPSWPFDIKFDPRSAQRMS